MISLQAIDLAGGPFDSVFDVGGNLGDFAEFARHLYPQARITSFEPLPEIADAQRERARGRWWVEPVAIGAGHSTMTMRRCVNQPSASSLLPHGTARSEHFGLRDRYSNVQVRLAPLDDYLAHADGRLLIKVDVEGYELPVLAGGVGAFNYADTVIIEMQNDPSIFLGAGSPNQVDRALRDCGLEFCGLADAFTAPAGQVLQFDAIYRRDRA